MRAFVCPVCHNVVLFEGSRCLSRDTAVGLHLPSRSMVALTDGTALIDGVGWTRCTQAGPLVCNWLVAESTEAAARGGAWPIR